MAFPRATSGESGVRSGSTNACGEPCQIMRLVHRYRSGRPILRVWPSDPNRGDRLIWPSSAGGKDPSSQRTKPRRTSSGLGARSGIRLERTASCKFSFATINVDQALKVLKKKMQREGVFREMKLRKHYEKPSERKTREKAEAIRRARKLARKKLQREGLLPPAKPRVTLGTGGRGGPARTPRF
jgi:small subunit ribosomal protein S21